MFKRVFIANRAVVARRIVRACADLGIDSVAAYADIDGEAPHLAEATATARLPGYQAADTYLNTERLVAAAKQTQADALHPGYGFLAERADFAPRRASRGHSLHRAGSALDRDDGRESRRPSEDGRCRCSHARWLESA